MRDFGLEAQQAAEKRLDACQEALFEEESREDPTSGSDLWPEDLSAPFCGCTTCVVREVLHAAWPLLEEASREPHALVAREVPCHFC